MPTAERHEVPLQIAARPVALDRRPKTVLRHFGLASGATNQIWRRIAIQVFDGAGGRGHWDAEALGHQPARQRRAAVEADAGPRPPALQRRTQVTDRVYALIKAVQSTTCGPPRNRSPTQSQVEKLPVRHHSMLPSGETRDL